MSTSSFSAPTHLRCEYLVNPLAIEAKHPRLSWELVDGRIGAVQTAYQIQVASSEDKLDTADVWDSGKVDSDQSIHVRFDGDACQPWKCYVWRVRIWDLDGKESDWSNVACWESGPMDCAGWHGQWIAGKGRQEEGEEPSPYLRKEFNIDRDIVSARLAVTSCGCYEMWINGKRVGNDYFTPGWTEYKIRTPYQVYDVTNLLQGSTNCIGGIIADGWYSGNLVWEKARNHWGKDICLLADLHVTFADGTTEIISTDDTWQWSEGPIRVADHYNGETYDAQLEMPGWSTVGFDASGWQKVTVFDAPETKLVPKLCENVQKIQELVPVEMTEPEDKVFVYDLGQNMVGWARYTISAPAGTKIKFRYAEMLNDDGTMYVANLRSAKATDYYICSGNGEEIYEPRFTFHGFRYIEITGLDQAPAIENVTGVVLHSASPQIGTFECSNEMVNKLQNNILWGQKGNFFEVPTDCPQRNERLGWTGDAQVFVRTACFNLDVAAFFTKYCQDLEDAQYDDGRFPDIAPNLLKNQGGNCAWADAGVICPWTVYLCYGDVAILDKHFDAMAKWVDFMEEESNNLIRPEYGYGDWLSIDGKECESPTTLKSLIGTAYFVLCARLVSKAATLTGRTEKAEHYSELEAKVLDAFQKEFLTPNGRLVSHSQTAYLLALGFDLLPADKIERATKHLITELEKRNWHLSTGFVGTPLLAPVLTKVGRIDGAYKLLLQDTYPSWFYSILNGATTMWERWNSYTKEHGFGDVSMNSFNHYAYGAIGEWMYSTIGGLDLDPEQPAYKHSIIKPRPGGEIDWAKTELKTMYGLLATDWKIEKDKMALTVVIPPNTTSTLQLPIDKIDGILVNGQAIADSDGIDQVRLENGIVTCEAVAGTYSIELPSVIIAE